MKIGIFGTGGVARSLAARLASLGHLVVLGTRDVKEAMADERTDAYGNPPYRQWQEGHPDVRLATLADAARHGELVINALAGVGTLSGLRAAGASNLNGKVLIDLANPLDPASGMPPALFVANTDSLGEQIQREFPGVRVVKSLNTVNAYLQVEPGKLGDGLHTMFVSGNDAEAKRQVTQILKEWFGWKDVIDLGDISGARGCEMLIALWGRIWGALGTPMFAFRVVR
jgi:predicted dinucleotide-binding enzyme